MKQENNKNTKINKNVQNINKKYNKEELERVKKIQKIALIILCAISLAIAVLFMVEVLFLQKQSFFSKHFAGAILLICVGFIILILVNQSKQKISGDGKGDNLMEKVAIAAFVLAILSIAISFISL